MTAPLSRMPALPLAVGLAAGILSWTISPSWYIVPVALAGAIILFFYILQYFAFIFFALAAGWIIADINAPQSPPEEMLDGNPRGYSATITDISTRTNSQTVILRIDSAEIGGHLVPCNRFLISAGSLPDWTVAVGDRMHFTGIIEPLDFQDDFPHDRNRRMMFLRQGIVGQTFLEEASAKTIGEERSLDRWFYQQRERVLHILAFSDLSEKAYALIAAITVGYDDELDSDLRENFRAAGIAHTLALSGFHVGIIIILVSVALFPLRAFYRLRKWRMSIALLMIWFYAAMVGMPASVVRTVLMLSIILLSKIAGCDSNPFNALCAALAIILAVSPFSVFSTGLQLSAAAVLGILIFAERLNPFSRKNRQLHWIGMLVTVPVAALLGTLPVTIAVFHRLPLFFLLSNVIVSIILPPLMICGIALILLNACGLQSLWLCRVTDFLADLTDKVAAKIAAIPFSELTGIYLSGPRIAALVCIIIAFAVVVTFPRRKVVITAAIIALPAIVVFTLFPEKVPDTEAFIIKESGNTPIVVRRGNRIDAVFTCSPDRYDNAMRRLSSRLADYAASRGVDSIVIKTGDFSGEIFSRQGDVLYILGKSYGLAHRSGTIEANGSPTDYAIISSGFRGTLEDVVNAFHPDTVILSRDLSLRRAHALKTDACVPVIDLRHASFVPH